MGDNRECFVMVMTMIFPVVIGLGGLLTQGTNGLVLPLIALIPALSTIGLVGALGRQILLDASRGISDPPRLPLSRTRGEGWRAQGGAGLQGRGHGHFLPARLVAEDAGTGRRS